MWLVQMPKIKPLPKETGVAAELYSSLAATFPPPNPLMKLHENSQQGCERCRPHLALTANPIQVLPGLRKQRKLTMELVKKRRQCVRDDVFRCLHLASLPWLGALPLVPQVPHAHPTPTPKSRRSHLLGFCLIFHRHFHHCRPHTESSLPRGCPKRRQGDSRKY